MNERAGEGRPRRSIPSAKQSRGGRSRWSIPSVKQSRDRKVCSIIQSDISGNSIDKDMHCERTGQMRVGKYLRESCYHNIECSIANSLVALMKK